MVALEQPLDGKPGYQNTTKVPRPKQTIPNDLVQQQWTLMWQEPKLLQVQWFKFSPNLCMQTKAPHSKTQHDQQSYISHQVSFHWLVAILCLRQNTAWD